MLLSHAYGDDALKNEIYNIASNDTRNLQDFVMAMKEVCGSQSELKFGGYNPEKDVNLNPDIRKIKEIVKPLTEWSFEEVIEKISK